MNDRPSSAASGSRGSAALSEEINLYRIWRVVVERRYIAAGFLAAVILLAVIYSLLAPVTYRATVSLIPASAAAGNQLGALGGLGGLASFAGLDLGGTEPEQEQALAVLQSRAFTTRFIQESNLLPVLYAGIWDAAKGDWSVTGNEIPSLNDAYKLFNRKIRRVAEHNNGVTTLTIDWRDPVQAADWANGLVETLNREMRFRAISEAEKSLQYLRAEQEKTSMVAVEQAISRLIESQVHSIMLANVRDEYSFRVIDPAVPPDSDDYVSPRRLLIVVVASVIGSVLALLLVLFLDLVKRQRTHLS